MYVILCLKKRLEKFVNNVNINNRYHFHRKERILRLRHGRPDKNAGFSLIELIIAIAILVILTGLLAPRFMRYIEKSREAVCRKNMDEMLNIFRAESISDVAYVLDDVIDDYKGKCPSGGLHSDQSKKAGRPWIMCSIHDEEDLKKDSVTFNSDNVYDSMVKFTGKTPKELEQIVKDLRRELGDDSINAANITNDTFRRYLFQKVYNGSWPEFDEEYKKQNGLMNDLYIQPCLNHGKKVGETNDQDVIVFATTNNSESGNWYTNLIYDPVEKVWYKGKNSFSVNEKDWATVKKIMTDEKWEKLQ